MKRDLKKVICERDNLVKKKNATNEREIQKRADFDIKLQKLWDVSCPDAEHLIWTDRLFDKDKDSKEEDIVFLRDQQGERKMELGELDLMYIAAHGDREKRLPDNASKVVGRP
jgi:hypothetical protein